MRAWMLSLIALCGCPSAPSHGVPVYAEVDPDEAPQGPMPIERGRVDRPFLYQVEANVPSLILGTTSAGVSLSETTIDAEALDGIRVVMVDVRLDQLTARDVARARMRASTLETWIGTIAWRDLLDELVGTATPDQLRHMRPWYAYAMLVGHRTNRLFDGEVPPPMAVSLATLANDLEIPVRTLETPGQRIGAMNAIPNELPGEILGHVLEHPTRHELHLRALHYKYRAGDENALFDQITTGLEPEAVREVYERLYIQHPEEAWMTRLRAELDEGNAFIAMDVGHLLGPEGMLVTLLRLGYSIHRVE